MTDTHDARMAWFKMAWVWAAVGVSQMTPLQVVQFVAAIAATVYSLVQTYLLVRDKIMRRRAERGEQ